MKNKTYEKPQIETVIFATEDIMSLSLNFTNDVAVEDSVNIKDLL